MALPHLAPSPTASAALKDDSQNHNVILPRQTRPRNTSATVDRLPASTTTTTTSVLAQILTLGSNVLPPPKAAAAAVAAPSAVGVNHAVSDVASSIADTVGKGVSTIASVAADAGSAIVQRPSTASTPMTTVSQPSIMPSSTAAGKPVDNNAKSDSSKPPSSDTPDEKEKSTPLANVNPDPTTMLTSSYPASRTGSPSAATSSGLSESSGKGGLSNTGQSALIAFGVLFGAITILLACYYLWRQRKSLNRHRYNDSSSSSTPFLEKPRRVVTTLFGRVPLIRNKFPSTTNHWQNMDDDNDNTSRRRIQSSPPPPLSSTPVFFAEKELEEEKKRKRRETTDVLLSSPQQAAPPVISGLSCHPPDRPKPEAIRVQTTFSQRSSFVPQMGSGLSELAPALVVTTTAGNGTDLSNTGSQQRPNPTQSSFSFPFTLVTSSPLSDTAQYTYSPRDEDNDDSAGGRSGGGAPARWSRVSELSSLSSGFGDGDIIVPAQAATASMLSSRLTIPRKPVQMSRRQTSSTNDYNGARNRLSTATMTTSASGGFGGGGGGDSSLIRRDTVYTEASEDSPPRFRTVNSWVRQQTGRVAREKQRVEDTATKTGTAPPVPQIPPEQEFRLMMPDSQVPRPVDESHTWSDSQTGDSASGHIIGTAR